MDSYKIQIKPSAAKELKKIPLKDRRRIVAHITELADDPRPQGCEKLSGADKYRIRQGNYRVVYSIQDQNLIVLVIRIAHRKEVYRT